MIDVRRLRAAYDRIRSELAAERTPAGPWVGELSTSALSTATAVSALAVVLPQQGISIARLPAAPLSCPLPDPVCDNNKICY